MLLIHIEARQNTPKHDLMADTCLHFRHGRGFGASGRFGSNEYDGGSGVALDVQFTRDCVCWAVEADS